MFNRLRRVNGLICSWRGFNYKATEIWLEMIIMNPAYNYWISALLRSIFPVFCQLFATVFLNHREVSDSTSLLQLDHNY